MRRFTQVLAKPAFAGQVRLASTEVMPGTDQIGFARHRNVSNLHEKRMVISAGCFIAPNATVIGKVLLFDRVSIMYGAVVRGDKSTIKIGTLSCVQDKAVIKTVLSLESGFPPDVVIGDHVTIGQGAILTSCIVGPRSWIGAGAIIGEGCELGQEVIVAAGSVVVPETIIPGGQLWAGNPAKYERDVNDEEAAAFETVAEANYTLAKEHIEEYLPYGTAYLQAEKLKNKL